MKREGPLGFFIVGLWSVRVYQPVIAALQWELRTIERVRWGLGRVAVGICVLDKVVTISC